jgi:hypothetical protein
MTESLFSVNDRLWCQCPANHHEGLHDERFLARKHVLNLDKAEEPLCTRVLVWSFKGFPYKTPICQGEGGPIAPPGLRMEPRERQLADGRVGESV